MNVCMYSFSEPFDAIASGMFLCLVCGEAYRSLLRNVFSMYMKSNHATLQTNAFTFST